jgi:hypothetical protein
LLIRWAGNDCNQKTNPKHSTQQNKPKMNPKMNQAQNVSNGIAGLKASIQNKGNMSGDYQKLLEINLNCSNLSTMAQMRALKKEIQRLEAKNEGMSKIIRALFEDNSAANAALEEIKRILEEEQSKRTEAEENLKNAFVIADKMAKEKFKEWVREKEELFAENIGHEVEKAIEENDKKHEQKYRRFEKIHDSEMQESKKTIEGLLEENKRVKSEMKAILQEKANYVSQKEKNDEKMLKEMGNLGFLVERLEREKQSMMKENIELQKDFRDLKTELKEMQALKMQNEILELRRLEQCKTIGQLEEKLALFGQEEESVSQSSSPFKEDPEGMQANMKISLIVGKANRN